MHTSKQLKNILVPVLFLIILSAAVCFAEPLIPGDFDEDKTVSFGDLQLLAQDWLGSSDVADMDDSGKVDFGDFSLFAANWQKTVPILVINEFMASNGGSYVDPQGDADDWIEIYNTTNSPINLAGMYITDKLSDLTKYQIPTGSASLTTVPAYGFLILWADEDMIDGANHVGVKLSASGEQIGLTASDGVTVIDSLTFGSQLPDISFGSYPDGSNKRRYFGVPTPGAANNEGYLGIMPTPTFSRESGIFTDTFQLTISVASDATAIHYTTDHGIPTESSQIYTGPITVSQTTEIIARAFKPGYAPSDVESNNFVKVSSEVANFSSNLPVVILDSFGYNIDAENDSTKEYPYRNVYAIVIDTNDAGRATVTDEPGSETRGGMRVRGQTSAGFPQRQYKFESWDSMSDDKDVSFLGMPADSDWIIHGPYMDKTMIRNHLTYRLARDMGDYAVRTQLCEVFNNQNDGVVTYSDYAGVYVFMENIKIGGERLQSEKLEPTDNALPEISGGYIIKQDKGNTEPPAAATNYFTTNYYYKHLQYDEPSVDELTQAQKNWIKSYCDQAEYALKSSNFADPVNGYQKYIDPDSFIDYFIIAEISRNVDGYILSDYMFKPRNGRIQRGPVWDYNYAWGNANYRNAWLIEGWQHIQNSDPNDTGWGRGSVAWLRRMFEDDNFYIRCIDRWYELRENVLKMNNMMDRIQGYADELEEAQQRHFARWDILGVNISPNWFVGETYKEEIDFLKSWVHDRLLWIDSQFPKPPVFNQDGGAVDASFALTISPAKELPHVHTYIDYNDSWSYLDNGTNQK
ncbi:MAG TPA: CotH kinase family protein, partial [Sedimentisphaerales bacterium]|nr:CotH kinase family protein [Sedimentisphaerales bacterium]